MVLDVKMRARGVDSRFIEAIAFRGRQKISRPQCLFESRVCERIERLATIDTEEHPLGPNLPGSARLMRWAIVQAAPISAWLMSNLPQHRNRMPSAHGCALPRRSSRRPGLGCPGLPRPADNPTVERFLADAPAHHRPQATWFP